MTLSTDQRKALENIINWYFSENSSQTITLGGFAGTGKTTLTSILRNILNIKQPKLKVAFCSYTGKGTLVLKNKLMELNSSYKQDNVSTIHSLIYEPITNKSQEIIGWSKKDTIKENLIIVDEASMINETIWFDLKSFNLPIIAIGDHGQLPPINGNFNLMKKPELLLTQIHRQAKDNPIINVSVLARTEGKIPIEKFGNKVQKFSMQDFDTQEIANELLNNSENNTLVLCGYNNTRISINSQIRQNLGFESPFPEPGDKVICLRNNHDKQIFNGMLGVIQIVEEHDQNWYTAVISMESGVKYQGHIYKDQFNSKEPINFTKDRKKLGNGDIFDFGYALTVHKAQGSEADKVILFEERFSQMDDLMWKRWLYTAVTRAKEELYIFGN